MKKLPSHTEEITFAKVVWEERPGDAEELNGIWWQGKP